MHLPAWLAQDRRAEVHRGCEGRHPDFSSAASALPGRGDPLARHQLVARYSALPSIVFQLLVYLPADLLDHDLNSRMAANAKLRQAE